MQNAQPVLLGNGQSPAALQIRMVGPSVRAVPIRCPRPGAGWADIEACCSKISRNQRLPFAWRFRVSFNCSAQVLEWLLLLVLLASLLESWVVVAAAITMGDTVWLQL